MFFHRHKGDLGEIERGSQESYDSVGVMENRRNRVCGQPTPREEERECVRIWKEVLSLLLSFSSVDDIMRSKGVTGGGDRLNDEINCSPLSDSLDIYLFVACLPQDSKHLFFGSTCLYYSIYLSWFHKRSICGSKFIADGFIYRNFIFNYRFSLFFLPQSPKVRPFSAMDGVPFFLSRVKAETPEDLLIHDLHFHTQTEPVDLSINKPRPSSSSATPTTALSPSPLRYAFSPSSLSSSSSSSSSSPSVITSASSVLTSGPLVPPGTGVRGQPYLHILHSVPPPPSSPLSLPGAGKLASHVHRIPVVVQSLPLMYTSAVRSPSSLNNAIMLPLLDEVKGQGKGGTTSEQNWLCIHDAWLGSCGRLFQRFPVERLRFSNWAVIVLIIHSRCCPHNE